mgnify:CR=1 FL=1
MGKKQKMTELAVKFKTFSCKQGTENIGIELDREEITIEEADALFTNARLEAMIMCDPNAKRDVEGQQTIKDMNLSLEIISETKGFRVDRDKFTFSMQVIKDSVDAGKFSKFAFRGGILKCCRIGECEEKGGVDGNASTEAA